jgi:hypothetical protein
MAAELADLCAFHGYEARVPAGGMGWESALQRSPIVASGCVQDAVERGEACGVAGRPAFGG